MFMNYVCPFCGHDLYFEKTFFLCHSCQMKFVVMHDIPLFNNNSSYYLNPIHEKKMGEILDSVDDMNWEQYIEKLFNEFPSDDARAECANMIFLETRAGWKYLTDLSITENALDLGCGMGTISLNLCRSFKNVFAMDMTLEHLKLAKKMSEARGFKNVTTVHGGDTKYLPFPSEFFDLICVNGALEEVPLNNKDDRADLKSRFFKGSDVLIEPWFKSNPLKIQTNYLNEINRILKPNGTLYLAAGNRFNYHYILKKPDMQSNLLYPSLMPRFFANMYSLIARRGSYRSYSHSYFSLKRILRNCSFKQIDFYSLKPDYRLFNEIIFFDKRKGREVREGNLKEKIKKGLYSSKYFCPSFGIVASKDEGRNNFIQNILTLMASENKRTYAVNRYYVMMKGNVVLDVADVNDPSSGLIIKIPVDDISESQNIKNYAMLSNMHNNSSLPKDVKGFIPRPQGRHTVNGQNIYLEEKINGIPAGRVVRDEHVKNMVLKDALDFIVRLHKATLIKVTWDENDYIKKIGNLIERVKHVGKNGQSAFEKIDKMMRNIFIGRKISVAQKHGDFSFANVLIDPKNYGIIGIIDWDNSEYDQPILIDLINLIESTYNFKDRELGYTITNILLQNKLSYEEREIVGRYLSTFGYPEDLILPYTLLYWLHHFHFQTKYNFLIKNPKWMMENYYNVITAINKIL